MQYQDRLGRNQSMRRYSSAVVERKLENGCEASLRTKINSEKQQREEFQKPSILLLDAQSDSSKLDDSFDFEPLNLVGDYCFVKPI